MKKEEIETISAEPRAREWINLAALALNAEPDSHMEYRIIIMKDGRAIVATSYQMMQIGRILSKCTEI